MDVCRYCTSFLYCLLQFQEDNACYLFDCGTPNVCELTDHPGFEVLTLPSRKSENKEQAKHEDALENLAATPEPSTIPPTTTTTPAPTARHEPGMTPASHITLLC